MDDVTRDPEGRMLIGPGLSGPAGAPLDDGSATLIEDARRRLREQEKPQREGGQIARRLVVAFVLVGLMAVLSFVVLPRYGLHLPPTVPVLAFVVIVAGSLLSADEPRPKRKRCECEDEGRAICCGGPRPLQVTRERDP